MSRVYPLFVAVYCLLCRTADVCDEITARMFFMLPDVVLACGGNIYAAGGRFCLYFQRSVSADVVRIGDFYGKIGRKASADRFEPSVKPDIVRKIELQ